MYSLLPPSSKYYLSASLVQDGNDTGYSEDNFGTVHGESYNNASLPYIPKPSYYAAQTLQNGIGNALYFTGRLAANLLSNSPTPATVDNIFAFEFQSGAQSFDYAVWSNITTCTAPTQRVDCGFYGITQMQCLSRGCCFDSADTTNVTQCYTGLPPVSVQLPISGSAPNHCFTAQDYIGRTLPSVCASASSVALNATDGPTYLYW
jgi:hypothetical protein